MPAFCMRNIITSIASRLGFKKPIFGSENAPEKPICNETLKTTKNVSKFRTEKVAIVGSGVTAMSWAMLFASVGYQVTIFDVFHKNVSDALNSIRVQLKTLESSGLLRGHLNADDQIKCIEGSSNLAKAVKDAVFIQECKKEHYAFKIIIFQILDALVDDNVILSTSTSMTPLTLFSDKIKHKSHVIVSHLVEPFYYGSLVEIVPTIWTYPWIVAGTKEIMKEIGQQPVSLTKEISGYIVNRIQYVILNEVWRLVEQGIVHVQDIDKLISEGLGMYYAFLGPFEIAHLSSEGIVNYIKRYGETIFNVCNITADTPPPCMNTSYSTEFICAHLNAVVPLEKLQERRAWRDACFMRLMKLRNEMNLLFINE
ncbi:lambda-crystallin homolog [Melitaea cinxia]|uniref:lambda-crystallin homolog n=1 Tax=Melitaea cinxia TaxID=113334 RepID=UPI001E270BED|nr:lambda-crystallin homolog [Melitaea cinxia]